MSEKSRYKWLIRPLIHRNAIASLDWIGKSAPVPLRYLERERTEGRKREKFYICLDVTHTHTFCASLRSQNALEHFRKAALYGNLQEQMPPSRSGTHTLCEPAQSKCTSTCHKSHFIRKFTGKMAGPRWSTLIKHRPLLLP